MLTQQTLELEVATIQWKCPNIRKEVQYCVQNPRSLPNLIELKSDLAYEMLDVLGRPVSYDELNTLRHATKEIGKLIRRYSAAYTAGRIR